MKTAKRKQRYRTLVDDLVIFFLAVCNRDAKFGSFTFYLVFWYFAKGASTHQRRMHSCRIVRHRLKRMLRPPPLYTLRA